MRLLDNNTLYNISKHSNKAVKFTNYIIDSDFPILLDYTKSLNPNSHPIEFIEAFRKDIKSTIKHAKDVHMLLSTVDENDNVIHLKNDEKNLSNIFGEHYDADRKIINFKNFSINLRKKFNPESLYEEITQNIMGKSCQYFEDVFKTRNKVFKLNDKELFNNDDKISFLSTIKDRSEYNFIIELIRGFSDDFLSYRKKMNLNERRFVDNEITFDRSMIDSVTKQSTFITQEKVDQISSSHKKDTDLLKKITKQVKDSNIFDAVEIDKDTDLEGVLNFLEKVKDVKFFLKNKITLKFRKLGNYNVGGMYYSNANVVAIDITRPDAAIHEFIHAVDIENKNILNSDRRMEVVEKFSGFISLNPQEEKKQDYYYNDKEVIARLGEISFVLNKYNYNQNEDFEDFVSRVQLGEEKEHSSDLRLTHTADFYFNQHPSIYFDFANREPKDILEIKEYFQSYYGIENKKIKEFKAERFTGINDSNVKLTGSKRLPHKLQPVALINSDNIKFILDYNKEKNFIKPEILVDYLIRLRTDISRTTKDYKNKTFYEQLKTIEVLSDWIVENNDLNLAYEFFKLSHIFNRSEPQTSIDLNAICNKDIKIDVNKIRENYEKKLNEIENQKKELEEASKIKKSGSNDAYSIRVKIRDLNSKSQEIEFKIIKDFQKLHINEVYNINSLKEIRSENKAIERKIDRNGEERVKSNLNSQATSRFDRIAIEMAKKIANNNNLSSILKHSSPDDIFLYAIFSEHFSKDLLKAFKDKDKLDIDNCVSILYEHGIIDQMEKHKDSYIILPEYLSRKRENNSKINITTLFSNISSDQYIHKIVRAILSSNVSSIKEHLNKNILSLPTKNDLPIDPNPESKLNNPIDNKKAHRSISPSQLKLI
jgi:hypothetical protein